MAFELFSKQREIMAAIASSATYILSRGGSRSGKTTTNIYAVVYRALAASNSNHAIFRATFQQAREHIFDKTLKEVISTVWPDLWERLNDRHDSTCSINHTELKIELPNGSVIQCFGMDDPDKRKGAEYSTILVDEADAVMDFDDIITLETRLAEVRYKDNGNGERLQHKVLFATNPNVNQRHWIYRTFIEKVNPSTGVKHPEPDDWAEIFINPRDNPHLPPDYIERAERNWSPMRKRVYLDGEWLPDDENAMFKSEWWVKSRLPSCSPSEARTNLTRIIVAVDPAVSATKGSDETGIIVLGIDRNGVCYILEDCSGVYQPEVWAEKAVAAYFKWNADCIIAERNNGGSLVTNNITTASRVPTVKTVWASNGKEVRAEPVVGPYSRGLVIHCGQFDKLEHQLATFTYDANKNRKNGSPDRLDALVWGLTELLVIEQEKRGGGSRRVKGLLF